MHFTPDSYWLNQLDTVFKPTRKPSTARNSTTSVKQQTSSRLCTPIWCRSNSFEDSFQIRTICVHDESIKRAR